MWTHRKYISPRVKSGISTTVIRSKLIALTVGQKLFSGDPEILYNNEYLHEDLSAWKFWYLYKTLLYSLLCEASLLQWANIISQESGTICCRVSHVQSTWPQHKPLKKPTGWLAKALNFFYGFATCTKVFNLLYWLILILILINFNLSYLLAIDYSNMYLISSNN